MVKEQQDLLKECRESQEYRMFEIAERLNSKMQQLSMELEHVREKNEQLEVFVNELLGKV